MSAMRHRDTNDQVPQSPNTAVAATATTAAAPAAAVAAPAPISVAPEGAAAPAPAGGAVAAGAVAKLGVDVDAAAAGAAAAPGKDPEPTTPIIGGGAAGADTPASAPTPAATAAATAAPAHVLPPLFDINTTGEPRLALMHGHHSAQGIRPTMEDEVVMFDHITLTPAQGKTLNGITSPIAFYGVFDGHGGKRAADFTKQHLVRNLVTALESGLDPAAALTQAFVRTDADFTAICGADTSGTTSVTLLIEQSTRKFWCANAGDSRCILARKGTAKALSFDHKADRPDELDRIRKAGGFVIHKRVMGELAISRAIGDKDFKAQDFKLVIADPEIVADALAADGTDGFLVLACDGLYDVMTNDQIVTWLTQEIKASQRRKAPSPTNAAATAAPVAADAAAAVAPAAAAAAPATPADGSAAPAAAAGAAAAAATPAPPASPSAATVAPVTPQLLEQVCVRLVTRAIDDLHTRDNVSAIVIKVRS